jgi:hypothetical protein
MFPNSETFSWFLPKATCRTKAQKPFARNHVGTWMAIDSKGAVHHQMLHGETNFVKSHSLWRCSVFHFENFRFLKSYCFWEFFLFNVVQVNAFIYDYTGYGRSKGGPSCEDSVYSDVRAAYQYLTHDLSLDPSSIILYALCWTCSLGHIFPHQTHAQALCIHMLPCWSFTNSYRTTSFCLE